jgi:hypothetical protein
VLHDGPFEIVLDAFEETAAYICGNLTKVKMADIDPKYNIRTYSTSRLDLTDDEGIPTGSVFLYLKQQEILFFQVAKTGVNTNQFCRFFEDFGGTGSITLSFVLSEEGFRKLASYDYISKIEVAIKGLDSGFALNQPGNSVKGVLKKFKDLSTNNLKLEISKGHRAAGLDLNSAKTFVQDLFRIVQSEDDGDGQKIQITGRERGEIDQSSIDLLISRYKRHIEIELTGDSRLNSEIHTSHKLQQIKALVNPVGRDLNRLFNGN